MSEAAPEEAVPFTLDLETGIYNCSFVALTATKSYSSNVKAILREAKVCPDIKWRFAFPSTSNASIFHFLIHLHALLGGYCQVRIGLPHGRPRP